VLRHRVDQRRLAILDLRDMAMQLGHVHIKTREDPQKVAQFYIDNFGATVKREIPGRGCQLDLHGVQLNVTTIIADQNHEQHVGIEHIAIETDDYAGALANFNKVMPILRRQRRPPPAPRSGLQSRQFHADAGDAEDGGAVVVDSLREKLIKIGAKVVSHGRYTTFQMAEVAMPRQMFQEILMLIAQLRAPPAPT
jgi:hypothetical protein